MNMVQLDLECVKCGWSWRSYAKPDFGFAKCEKCGMVSAMHGVVATCRFTYDQDLVPQYLLDKLDARASLNKDELTVPIEKRKINLVNPLTGEWSEEIVDFPVPDGSFMSIDPMLKFKPKVMGVNPVPPMPQLPIVTPEQTKVNRGPKPLANLTDYELWASGDIRNTPIPADERIIRRAKELFNSGLTVESALAVSRNESVNPPPAQPPRSPLVPVKRKFEFDGESKPKEEEPKLEFRPAKGLSYKQVQCASCFVTRMDWVDEGVTHKTCDECIRNPPPPPQYLNLY